MPIPTKSISIKKFAEEWGSYQIFVSNLFGKEFTSRRIFAKIIDEWFRVF